MLSADVKEGGRTRGDEEMRLVTRTNGTRETTRYRVPTRRRPAAGDHDGLPRKTNKSAQLPGKSTQLPGKTPRNLPNTPTDGSKSQKARQGRTTKVN